MGRMVSRDCTGERLGISEGDVIVSYNGHCDFTPHKYEHFLLSLGWGYLASGDASWTVDLEESLIKQQPNILDHKVTGVTVPGCLLMRMCDEVQSHLSHN
ncbi:hypothetical protein E2562_027013 [Oryza meyeriana var. granulata]|uniref:Uncharacterized protein n=1 Tax=Oryza meyeriana var. granulata TaxID=110450 RepID=A0A6G1EPW9_9ORYZ|nr:hypothetical protein E2562_027013 [Oryza meyeriana var. granulata]